MTMIDAGIDEEVAAAQRRAADRKAAADAMASACQGECKPPTDMMGAAKLIEGLIDQRNSLQDRLAATVKASSEFSDCVRNEIAAIQRGTELAPGSVLHGIAKLKDAAEKDRDAAKAELAGYIETLKASMAEVGISEFPGLAGYYVPQGKLLTAMQSISVSQFGNNRSKEAFLRRRGWKWIGNGGWEDPGGRGAMSFDSAVVCQLRTDIAPFEIAGRPDNWPMPTLEEMTKPAVVAKPSPLPEPLDIVVPDLPAQDAMPDDPILDEDDAPIAQPLPAPAARIQSEDPFDPDVPFPSKAFNVPASVVMRGGPINPRK